MHNSNTIYQTMSELEAGQQQNFPLTFEMLRERLSKKLQEIKLPLFHDVVCRRAEPVWVLPQVTLVLQRFLRDKYASKHASKVCSST